MWHRLALALGATVAELRERMTYREFRAWAVYEQLEPFGALRDEVHARMVCVTIANTFGRRRRASLNDFALRFGPRARQSPADIRAVFRLAASLAGVAVINDDDC